VNPCLSGGAIEVFLRPHAPEPAVHVVGSSPVAHALVTTLTGSASAPIGWTVASSTRPARSR
jgi:xanthine/CO dehydrogenase XdhC/CoxF family maturation factor